MNAPSRGVRASAITTRYLGCFFAPMRRSRILSTGPIIGETSNRLAERPRERTESTIGGRAEDVCPGHHSGRNDPSFTVCSARIHGVALHTGERLFPGHHPPGAQPDLLVGRVSHHVMPLPFGRCPRNGPCPGGYRSRRT